jgi:hypothetical protein
MSETSDQKRRRYRRLYVLQGVMALSLVGLTVFSLHEYWTVAHGNSGHRTPEDLALGFFSMSLMALGQSVMLWASYRERARGV